MLSIIANKTPASPRNLRVVGAYYFMYLVVLKVAVVPFERCDIK